MASNEESAEDAEPYTFDVFEVVLADPPPAGHLMGRTATVLGRSRDDDGSEYYALAYDGEDVTMVDGRQLTSTGQRRRREEFYDGTSIRVSRDGRLLED